MIKYLGHKEIDFIKYDKCIADSENSMIYAYSWYLDIVAENWDALVLADYKMVMPLTQRKKYGITYIFLPAWVQQLGIFSAIEIKQEIIKEFLKAIPRKFKSVDILFNYNNPFSNKYLSKRDNFILKINHPYELLFEGYNKLRKRSLKKAQQLNLIIKEVDSSESIIDLFKENKGADLKKNERDYELLNQLILKGTEQLKVEMLCASDKNNNLLGGVVFLKNKNRIIYLFSAVNIKGKESQAITSIIDYIIRKYSGREMILDFEGSMIPGIAKFFRSFGAIEENYYWYSSKRII